MELEEANNVQPQPLVPDQIVSPHPWRRIFIGCMRRQADVQPQQLWFHFGLDEKSLMPKDMCYLHPVGGQLAPAEAGFDLMPDTIPEVLFKGTTWRVAAWELAMQHFGSDVRKTCNELLKEQNEWRYAESKRKRISSGPFLSESKKPWSGKRHSRGDDDDYELYYDDTSIQRIWNEYGKPCSGWVTLRMAEVIQNRFGTATPPPQALLEKMRLYRMYSGAIDDPDRIFFFHGWLSWIGKNGTTLEVVEKRASL